MKKRISLILALILIMSTSIVFAEKTDYEKSWAKKEISYMIDKGFISGYGDGSFRADNKMTRAEYYRLINVLVGYSEKEDIIYENISQKDWFYEEVQKASKAGYLPDEKEIKFNENITRGEVVQIIGKIYNIEENIKSADKFIDSEKISKEIKGILGGLRNKGYIVGYPDKSFKPESEISRAEVVKILYELLDEDLRLDEEEKEDETEEEEKPSLEEKEEIKEKEDTREEKASEKGYEVELFINFNKSLDRDRAENPTNYLFRKEEDGKVYDLIDLDGQAIIDSDGKRVIIRLPEFEDGEYNFLELSPSLRDKDNNRLSGNRFMQIKNGQIINN